MTDQTPATLDDQALLRLVTDGDCARLSPAQQLAYYRARCQAAGLDERTAPFQLIRLNGKLVLYALKSATDQLAAQHGIVCEVLDQRTEDGIRVVTVRARAKDGRQTDDLGAVPVKGLAPEAYANAMMKCLTKAKRRAILSLCGLGMIDETELETVPHTAVVQQPSAALQPVQEKAAESVADTARRVFSEPLEPPITDTDTPPPDPELWEAESAEPPESSEPPEAYVPTCPDHGVMRYVPPGTSKKTNKAYDGFYGCTERSCKRTVSLLGEKDRKHLFAALHEHNRSEDEFRQWLADTYGWESTKQITSDVRDSVFEWIKDNNPGDPDDDHPWLYAPPTD